MSRGVLHISLQAWLALVGLGLTLWVAIMHAPLILEIFWILLGAFLLSLALRPPTDYLAHRRVPRGITVLLVYIVLCGLVAFIAGLLVPVVQSEIATLRADSPTLMQQAQDRLSTTGLTGWIPTLESGLQGLAQQMDSVVVGAASTAMDIGSVVIDLLVLFILAYFLTIEPTTGATWVVSWVPAAYRAQVAQGWETMVTRLSRWVWAQVGVAVYFIVTSTLGLLALGVPFALTIGLVGGLIAVIPFLGAAVATLIAVFSALTVSNWLVVWVILLYIALATVESHILAPVLYGRALGLRPAVVLIALLIGAKTAGVLGVFFAVPIAVVIAMLVKTLRTIYTDAAHNRGADAL